MEGLVKNLASDISGLHYFTKKDSFEKRMRERGKILEGGRNCILNCGKNSANYEEDVQLLSRSPPCLSGERLIPQGKVQSLDLLLDFVSVKWFFFFIQSVGRKVYFISNSFQLKESI